MDTASFASRRSRSGIGSLATGSPTGSPARFSSKTATLLDFHDHQRHIIPLGLTIGGGREFSKDAFWPCLGSGEGGWNAPRGCSGGGQFQEFPPAHSMLVGRISGCEAQRVIPYAAKRFVFVNPYCHSAGLVSPARLRCASLPGGRGAASALTGGSTATIFTR